MASGKNCSKKAEIPVSGESRSSNPHFPSKGWNKGTGEGLVYIGQGNHHEVPSGPNVECIGFQLEFSIGTWRVWSVLCSRG